LILLETRKDDLMRTDELYEARDFESFWKVYERKHARRSTRALHAVGTTAAMALVTWGLVRRRAAPILLAPLLDYAIAQSSHRLIEHNRTTPLRSPVWHLRAELRLWKRTCAAEGRRAVGRSPCSGPHSSLG
jgi:hypothetical protein